MRGPFIPVALLFVLLGAPAPAAAQEVGTEPPAIINPNPLSSLSLDSLSATRSAPLFTPSRTAPSPEPEVQSEEPPPPTEVAADPEQPPPAVELIGIVLTDAAKTALLRDPASNEVHRLTNGDELQGWALTIVDARSVELRSGERVEGLKLFETFAAPATEPPQQPFDESQPPPPPPPDKQSRPPQRSGPQSGDIVKGADPQGLDSPDSAPGAEPPSPDVGPAPPDVEPPAPDAESPPPEDTPPSADFAPRPGNAPIPEEGALPPQGNSNSNQ